MVNESVATIPYATLLTLISNKQIVPGTLYKIADRGDRGIYLIGLTSGTVSRDGIRVMLCPKTYKEETLDGNSWKGVWRSSKTAAINDLFIWGGHVWKNITGNIGDSSSDYELDNVNWQAVSKSSFSSHEYVEMTFTVSYLVENDWIEQQVDGQNVIIGMPYAMKILYDYPINPVDHTDWNMGTACIAFRNVRTIFGVINNIVDGAISGVNAGGIQNNKVNFIQNVVCNPVHTPASDVDVLGAIADCECNGIFDINRSGGIKEIPETVGQFSYQTDDESFYIEWNFGDGDEEDGPINNGETKLRNCILDEGVALIEMNVIGVDLSGTGSPQIKIGLEVDDENYITFTSLSTLNAGVRNSNFGNKTTDTHRAFKISVTGGDVTGGRLKISGKYL